MTHIKNAKITTHKTNISNWEKPLLMKCDSKSFGLLPTKDFSKLVLPSKFKENMLMLAPSEYLEVLNVRNNIFSEIQNLIKTEKLTHEQEKVLHVAIQGFFKDWVVNNKQIKSITDLLKMIDQDEKPSLLSM